MRTSKRTAILDAIIDIIEREGMTAVTFDAVATETGLTRGGLLYHFRSREELLLATHRHAAERWEAEIEAFAGGGADGTPPAERHAAYVRNSARSARRVDLLLFLESALAPEVGALWADVAQRWAPPVPDTDDPAALASFIAGLAADGLWMYGALAPQPLPEALKDRITAELVKMVGSTNGSS